MDAAGVEAEWVAQLREAGGELLERVVDRHLAEMGAREVRLLLRNPYLTPELVAKAAAAANLTSVYEVRRDLVLHPLAPRIAVLGWIGGLFWPDLVRAGRDPRLHPTVRRAADQRLIERLPGLALGEKIGLARGASAGVISHLRHDPSPRVVAALLDNPHLTEGLLAPLLANDTAAPRALAVVAAAARWTSRYPVRLALVRNPRTPLAAAMSLLPLLKKRDLLSLTGDPRLDGALRQRARLLSGGADERSRRSPFGG